MVCVMMVHGEFIITVMNLIMMKVIVMMMVVVEMVVQMVSLNVMMEHVL